MKLPRYLQLALLGTAAVVIWSLNSEEEPAAVHPVAQVREPARKAKPVAAKKPADTPLRNNLFHSPVAQVQQVETPPEAPPETPSAPPLPLEALGAWWSGHQRIVLLTDGRETWPVCQRCRADNKIWIGSSPVSGWTLKAVEKDHLLFEWQLTHIQQRLELGDLQSEPTQ